MRVSSPLNGLPVPYRPRHAAERAASARQHSRTRQRKARRIDEQEYIAAAEARYQPFTEGLSSRSKEALAAYLSTAKSPTAQWGDEWVRIDIYV